MDKDMGKIVELITMSMLVDAQSKKIRDVIWEHMRVHNVECTDEYNDFTVEQFLVLYRIKCLYNNGIINEEAYNSLYNLYLTRIKLEDKFGELVYEDIKREEKKNEEKAQAIYEQMKKIDVILRKYNILIDYNILFNPSIEKGQYDNLDCNEIKELIKEIVL